MGSNLPRELLKWTLSLDLSYPIKHPRRDLCNGFLFAEVLSRYYPGEVQMHSFDNVTSVDRKKANWALLMKLFKRKRMPVDKSTVDRVIAAEGDAAVEVLQTIYSFIHQSSSSGNDSNHAYEHPQQPREDGCDAGARGTAAVAGAHWGRADFVPQPAADGHMAQQQQQQQQQQQPVHAGDAMAYGSRQCGGGFAQPTYADGLCGNPSAAYGRAAAGLSGIAGGVPAGDGYAAVHSSAGVGAYPPELLAEMAAMQQQLAEQQAAYEVALQQQQQQQQQHAVYGVAEPQHAPPAFVIGGGAYGAAGVAGGAEHTTTCSRAVPVDGSYGAGRGGADGCAAAYVGGVEVGSYAAACGGYAVAHAYDAEPPHASSSSSSPDRQADGIAYSRKPRPVDYQPYSAKDYASKDYNIKQPGKGYWELGKLGADLESEELQGKREKQERIKQMAAKVREDNLRRAAAAAPKPKPAKEPTARERALQFAKNVPKPEVKPKLVEASDAPATGMAARKGASGAASRRGIDGGGLRGGSSGSGYATKLTAAEPGAELSTLEEQHRRDQERVDAIRAQLAHMLN